jgi:hypothetical protein
MPMLTAMEIPKSQAMVVRTFLKKKCQRYDGVADHHDPEGNRVVTGGDPGENKNSTGLRLYQAMKNSVRRQNRRSSR